MNTAAHCDSPGIMIQSMTHQYGGETVLSDIQMTVKPGEFVTLIGPSGCGKSTLLRLVAGLESLQTGRMHFPNPSHPASPESHDHRRAFVFQDSSLLPWRNVYDNVGMPLELKGISKNDRCAKILEQLKRVGLREEDRTKLPRMLSGGMKMRVSLARALVTDPEILLMDEPFSALDDILRTQLNHELLGLWEQQNWTTLFVTHQVAEAAFLSDRVIVMNHHPGKIHKTITIDLPRPRLPELRESFPFLEVVNRLQKSLSEVV